MEIRAHPEKAIARRSLRRTGVRLLGHLAWGRHTAVFYDGEEELLEVIVPFLSAGLASNESCVWTITAPLTPTDAWAALREAVPALDRHKAEGRIEVLRSQTWYLTGDTPDLKKVERGWEAKLKAALDRGFDGLRVAASAPRMEEKQWADFLDYERRLNHHLAGKAMLVLCAYPLGHPHARAVAQTHASSLQKRGGRWRAR
jgi:hypothetical protein